MKKILGKDVPNKVETKNVEEEVQEPEKAKSNDNMIDYYKTDLHLSMIKNEITELHEEIKLKENKIA